MPGVHREPSAGLADGGETTASFPRGQGLPLSLASPRQGAGSWRRSDPGPLSSCRYLYNRMGYWSDWSVPILLTAATTFTYIAGLLVSRTGPAPEGRRGLCRADRGQLAFPFSLLLHLRGLAPPRWEVSLPLPHPAVFSSPHSPNPNPWRVAAALRSRCRLPLPGTSALVPAPRLLFPQTLVNPFVGFGTWNSYSMN